MAQKLDQVIFSTKKSYIKSIIFILFFLIFSSSNLVFGWFDETHLAVAKVAGYNKWYNAVGPDITKIKAGDIEKFNHFFDNFNNIEVTPEMVLQQAKSYNSPGDLEGHLYGAIIASLREYQGTIKKGKYAEYHLAFATHYMTDLSAPLHNIPYDDFNKKHHDLNDGIVEDEVLGNILEIKANMKAINLNADNFENDLAKEIAKIANRARKLGYQLKKEDRVMTKKEAYKQLGQSASLLKAVLIFLKK
jgi:hypothetical protein